MDESPWLNLARKALACAGLATLIWAIVELATYGMPTLPTTR